MKSAFSTAEASFRPVNITVTLETRAELAAFLALAQAVNSSVAYTIAEQTTVRGVTAANVKAVIDGLLTNGDFNTLKQLV